MDLKGCVDVNGFKCPASRCIRTDIFALHAGSIYSGSTTRKLTAAVVRFHISEASFILDPIEIYKKHCPFLQLKGRIREVRCRYYTSLQRLMHG